MKSDAEIIQEARERYCHDDLEIDSEPLLSHGDIGTWVQAWVWVPNTESTVEETED